MLKHTAEIYKKIESELKIPMRIIRWYVSEGLIPQPVHEGRKAFYDIDATKLIERLRVIKLLQNEFKYPLDRIKEIISKYNAEDIGNILPILEVLKKDYPAYSIKKGFTFRRNKIVNGRFRELSIINAVVQNEFFSRLEKGVLGKFNLSDMVKFAKSMSMEGYEEYAKSNETYGKGYWMQYLVCRSEK